MYGPFRINVHIRYKVLIEVNSLKDFIRTALVYNWRKGRDFPHNSPAPSTASPSPAPPTREGLASQLANLWILVTQSSSFPPGRSLTAARFTGFSECVMVCIDHYCIVQSSALPSHAPPPPWAAAICPPSPRLRLFQNVVQPESYVMEPFQTDSFYLGISVFVSSRVYHGVSLTCYCWIIVHCLDVLATDWSFCAPKFICWSLFPNVTVPWRGGDLGRLLDHKGGALTDGTRALLEGTPECPLVPSATWRQDDGRPGVRMWAVARHLSAGIPILGFPASRAVRKMFQPRRFHYSSRNELRRRPSLLVHHLLEDILVSSNFWWLSVKLPCAGFAWP